MRQDSAPPSPASDSFGGAERCRNRVPSARSAKGPSLFPKTPPRTPRTPPGQKGRPIEILEPRHVRQRSALVLLILAITVACVPLAKGETPAAASTAPPTEPPSPKGRCGDSVCDEREQQDPSRCPEDCGTVAPFPSPVGDTAPTPEPGQTADIVFAVVDGVPLTLDLYLPETEGPHPAVVLIHGGAWQSGDKASHAGLGAEMAKWGYVGVAVNYRLAPDHTFPAPVADVQCSIAWVREHAGEYGIDPDRIALLGTSAGAHLAVLAAMAAAPGAPSATWQPTCGDAVTNLRVQAVISCFGPLDLAYHDREEGGPRPVVTSLLGQPCQDVPDLCAEASPITYASAGAPPALLIHGTADDVVGAENSERMAEALQAAGAEAIYLPIEGAEHSFIFKFQSTEAQEALTAIEQFLAQALVE
jgi:acetyl esterase/lipase